jgi:hypothetical protein
MNQPTYKIVRYYQNDRKAKVQRTGLTLKQAQAWCNDPETSSKTKGDPSQLKLSNMDAKQLHWFDGYTEA